VHLVELSIMEQRYQAVMAILQDGWKVTEAQIGSASPARRCTSGSPATKPVDCLNPDASATTLIGVVDREDEVIHSPRSSEFGDRGYSVRTVTPNAASIESIGEKNDVSVSVHPAVLLATCCP
jgi:hypothetical protein